MEPMVAFNYTAYGSVVRSPAWRPGTEQMAFEYTEIQGQRVCD